jgi:sterol desaturase/sphingolipid hydroxylase (fatty acid hydroxylase superfamily)
MFEAISTSSLFRPMIFLLGLILFLVIERRYAFRRPRSFKMQTSNFFLTFINSAVLIVLSPGLIGLISSSLSTSNVGLLKGLNIPFVFKFALSFLILDFAIYWQHRLFHTIPLFWRFHKVHHSDQYFDTSTALRFHLIEILLSFAFKATIVIIMGISPIAFLFFEVVLNLSAMFNHSNFKLPSHGERLISLLIVSPSFHRVHHSVLKDQTNSNYGFCLSIWDRAFSSFSAYDSELQKKIEFGLEEFRSNPQESVKSLILQPFSSNITRNRL